MPDATNVQSDDNKDESSDSEILESLFESFESAWEETPFPDLRHHLSESTDNSRNTVLTELIQIDLERRWRSKDSVPEGDPLPARPEIEDYIKALPELGDLDRIPLEIIVAEFRVRQIWGDRPDISDFSSRFPRRETEVASACEALDLDSIARPTLAYNKNISSATEEDVGNAVSDSDQTLNEISPEKSFRSLSAGMQISHYSLGAQIGKGGFGVVFLAQNLDRPYQQCALKLIRPDRLTAPKLAARFKQEIAALAGLSHPNIACASDSGEWQGVQFLVMEYVDGTTLNRLISRRRQTSLADACELMRQTAIGLQHIHEMNRTHRDLKPSNLILTSDGTVKILDLGMARLTDIDDPEERLTSLGDVMGTPDYMAPEQWQDSRQVDIRGDIYSLGCTLYCLLAGRPPFANDANFDPVALMRAHSESPIPDISDVRDDVPSAVVSLIAECMSKSPDGRPAEPQIVADRLSAFVAEAEPVTLAGVLAAENESCIKPTLIESETAPQQEGPPGETLLEPQSPHFGASETTPPAPEHMSDMGTLAEPAPNASSEITPPGTDRDETLIENNNATILPSFEETLIERSDEFESKSAGQSIKPPASAAPPESSRQQSSFQSDGSSSSTMRSYSSTGSVVLRPREVTYGKVTGENAAEYEIGAKLGEGGMGAVYRARQGSVDRGVALKMVKKDYGPANAQDMFLAEAIVTGTLEHPNIVPVYDLGVNAGGELFYAMKEVRGGSWKERIDTFDPEENLEVLVKVTDAIAYSHEKGVIHRDLKPDNIMIGEFGEVVVMDWGLALPTTEFDKPGLAITEGLAGTPSYMAPEMADLSLGPIGRASDIYLLGALLFRIVTGHAPHTGKTALAALRAAAANVIQWPKDDDTVDSELLEIARKAMATNPDDRYASALDFKTALRDYRSHSESRRLTDSAERELTNGESSGNYRSFERAIAALEEAINLWSENDRATSILRTARLKYAKIAIQKGDLDLAESQLSTEDPLHEELLKLIQHTRAEREAQALRLRRMKQGAVGMSAIVFLTVSVSAVMINSARHKENLAREQEKAATTEAVQRLRETTAAIAELSDLADALRDYPLAQTERQKLLQVAANFYARQASRQSALPEVLIEQLRCIVRLGEIENEVAEHVSAMATWERAIALARDLQKDIELADQGAILHAHSLTGRARSLIAQGQTGAAREAVATSINMMLEVSKRSNESDIQADIARMQLQQTSIEKTAGKYQSALSFVNAAIGSLEKLTTLDQSDSLHKELAVALSMRAQIQELTGEYVQAANSAVGAIDLWKQLAVKHPESVAYADGLATSQIDTANILRVSERNPIEDYSNAISTFERLVELRPGIPRYRYNLATALSGLAWTQNRLLETEAAQESAVQSVNTMLFLGNGFPDNIQFLLGEVSARLLLSEILRDRGEFDLAVGILEQASGTLQSENFSPDLPQSRERFGELLLIFGQVQSAIGDTQLAQESLRQSADVMLELAESDAGLPRHRDSAAWALFHLSHELTKSQDHDGAREAVSSAIEIRNKLPDRATWLDNFAWLLIQSPVRELRDASRAESLAASAVNLAQKSPRLMRTLTLTQLRTGKHELAARTLDQSKALTTNDHPEEKFLSAIVAFQRGDVDQANELFSDGTKLLNNASPANPRLLLIQHEAANVIGTAVPVK